MESYDAAKGGFEHISESVHQLVHMVNGIEIAPIDTSEPVDEKLVSWYAGRFKMLREDGVPKAITYYIEKLQGEPNINDHTMMQILSMALNGD